MRKLLFMAILAFGVLASCTTDQIETTDNESALELTIDSIETQNQQQTTRDLSGGIDPGPDPSRIDCIEDNLCANVTYPTHPGGMGYIQIHIWYSEDMKPSEIECLRAAYFRCFDGDLWMRDWQPSDPHHDIWLRDIGKPDNGLGSTTTDDPRVCNNPTNSCD